MDLSDAYEQAAYIPDAEAYRTRWPVAAADFRARIDAAGRARLGLAYGSGERQRFDLFLPAGRPAGLAVFVHGGYWKALDRAVWSHLAAGPVARGWACVLPSYTLAPAARISGITREIAAAITAAAGQVAGPVVVAGHSAGGHLAARMRCRDVALPVAVAGRLARVVAISPLADLRPLMRTAMNAELRLDEREAKVESPALIQDLRTVETVVWVGAEERPAFLDQARWLVEAWPDARLKVAPGRHHFDVVEELEDPEGSLTEAVVAGVT